MRIRIFLLCAFVCALLNSCAKKEKVYYCNKKEIVSDYTIVYQPEDYEIVTETDTDVNIRWNPQKEYEMDICLVVPAFFNGKTVRYLSGLDSARYIRELYFEDGSVTIPAISGGDVIGKIVIPYTVNRITSGKQLSAREIVFPDSPISLQPLNEYEFTVVRPELKTCVLSAAPDLILDCETVNLPGYFQIYTMVGNINDEKWKNSSVRRLVVNEGTEVLSGVFEWGSTVESISIAESVERIDCSFCDCYIGEVEFLHNGMVIGASFMNCSKLKKVRLTRDTYLYAESFSLCENLEKVYIPEGVMIMDGCFKRCPQLTLMVLEGSQAHEYAVNNNIDYQFWDGGLSE